MRGILHGAVPGVLARHAPRELVQVRLADDAGARLDQALDRACSPLGHVVSVDAGPVRRPNARGVDQVLHEEPLPAQRSWSRRSSLDLGDERVPVVGHGTRATSSISTFAPGSTSLLTSTSVLAGRVSPKNSSRTGLMRARSSMSVRNTFTFATSANLAPAAARIAPRFVNTCRVCATTS